MAINKRISELNSVTVADGGDLLAIVDITQSPDETRKIEVSDLMGSPGPIGLSNPNQAKFTSVTMVNTVNEFSIDGTFVGNSDTAVPTEKATKTYVDTAISNATSNVVRLDVINITSDSTATVGDAILADTTSGEITIDLIPDGDGRILILQTGINSITIISSTGILYDGGPVPSVTLDLLGGSREFLCNGSNFYVI